MTAIRSIRTRAAIAAALMTLPVSAVEPGTQECLAASEASVSLRRESKLHAAREQLLVCAAASCPVDVRTECSRRVGEVNAEIATVVFEGKDASGADVIDAKVMMDGQLLTERMDGTALTIDPGTHVFRFEARGFAPVEKTLAIRQGEKNRHERIAFALERSESSSASPAPADDAGSVPATTPGDVESTPSVDRTESLPHRPRSSSLPTVGLVTGIVGVVAMGVGAALLLPASNAYSASNEDGHCTGNDCDGPGTALRNEALSFADTSTGLFIGGGVLAAAGVTLFVVGKVQERDAAGMSVAPVVAAGGGGVLVRGRF